MRDKLEAIKKRFEEVSQLMVQPDAMADMKKYGKLSKEYKDLDKIVKKYDAYRNVLDNLANTKKMLETERDAEFREMAKLELEELYPQKEEMEEEIKAGKTSERKAYQQLIGELLAKRAQKKENKDVEDASPENKTEPKP